MPKASPSASKMRLEPIHPSELRTDDEPTLGTASESFGDETKDVDMAKNAEAIKTRQAAEHVAEIQNLTESGHYYLPINQVKRRRTKQLIWFSLVGVVAVGLVWFYLLLDARILTIPGLSVPTHFLQ